MKKSANAISGSRADSRLRFSEQCRGVLGLRPGLAQLYVIEK
jgi:hypothetical protein